MLLVLLACAPPPAPTTDDPGEVPEACPEGEVRDGDACVPAACGVGAWGDLAVDEATIRVDASVDEGGDGSEGAPFARIQEGVDLAASRGGGDVVVAAGTYVENLRLGSDHDGTRILGRCPELVTLDGSGGDEEPALFADATGTRAPDLELAGLTVTGGYAGLRFAHARAVVSDVVLDANRFVGVLAYESAEVSVTGSVVRGTETVSRDGFGYGASAEGGGTLTFTRTVLEANHTIGAYAGGAGSTLVLVESEVVGTLAGGPDDAGVGVQVAGRGSARLADSVVEGNLGLGVYAQDDGTEVELTDTVVRGTLPLAEVGLGRGVWIAYGAHLAATRVRVEENTEVGLFVALAGATAEVEDVWVTGTRPRADGTFGRGVEVYEGASLSGSGLHVDANLGTGLFASDAGTTVALSGSTITDTRLDAAADGRGLDVQRGATVTLTASEIAGNDEVGVTAFDAGTTVTLTDTVVSDTHPLPDGSLGRGVEAYEGAEVALIGGAVERNHGAGVLAVHEGSRIRLDGTVVSGTRRGRETAIAVGVASQLGGRVEGTGCTIQTTEGIGAYANAGTVTLDGCVVADNSFAGALAVSETAVLELWGTTIRDTLPDAELGGGVGVFAAALGGPTTIDLQASTVGPHPYAAVWLEGPGRYTLVGNDLSGSAGVDLGAWRANGNAVFAKGGVAAWAGEDGLWLEGNTLRDAPGVAVLLHGASASLVGNVWSGNGVDAWQQRCDGVAPLSDSELVDVPSWERCPDGNLLVGDTLTFPGLFLPETDIAE